jgi:plasmid stabilization system protein ParE
MEIKVVWTKRAEKNLIQTITYLEKEWTKKEILRLQKNIQQFIEQIKIHPYIFPTCKNNKSLFKGMVDENNYIVYRIYTRKKQITILTFRDAKRKPIH